MHNRNLPVISMVVFSLLLCVVILVDRAEMTGLKKTLWEKEREIYLRSVNFSDVYYTIFDLQEPKSFKSLNEERDAAFSMKEEIWLREGREEVLRAKLDALRESYGLPLSAQEDLENIPMVGGGFG